MMLLFPFCFFTQTCIHENKTHIQLVNRNLLKYYPRRRDPQRILYTKPVVLQKSPPWRVKNTQDFN